MWFPVVQLFNYNFQSYYSLLLCVVDNRGDRYSRRYSHHHGGDYDRRDSEREGSSYHHRLHRWNNN